MGHLREPRTVTRVIAPRTNEARGRATLVVSEYLAREKFRGEDE